MWNLLTFILITLAPITELRISIPFGLTSGMSPFFVIPVAIILNILVFFPAYFAFKLFSKKLFIKFKIVRKIVEQREKKAAPYIEKYGILGLAIYIGIPLPITGVWTGALIACILNLEWKKSFLAVCIGVLIAGTIISAISLSILTGFKLLLPAV